MLSPIPGLFFGPKKYWPTFQQVQLYCGCNNVDSPLLIAPVLICNYAEIRTTLYPPFSSVTLKSLSPILFLLFLAIFSIHPDRHFLHSLFRHYFHDTSYFTKIIANPFARRLTKKKKFPYISARYSIPVFLARFLH